MTEHYRIENGVIRYYREGVQNSAPALVEKTKTKPKTRKKK